MAKIEKTLLKELAKNVTLKSKVIEVKFSSDNNYKILKIELTSDIKDAIKGIHEDVLSYSFTKNGRVIEGIKNKDISFKGYSVDDFNVGEKVSIYYEVKAVSSVDEAGNVADLSTPTTFYFPVPTAPEDHL